MASLCSLPPFFLSFSFVFLWPFSNFIDARAPDYIYPTTATLPAQWTNEGMASHSEKFEDGSMVQPILIRDREDYRLNYGPGSYDLYDRNDRYDRGGGYGPGYACGFYCNGNCNTYLFAVFITLINDSGLIDVNDMPSPKVVWSANRNNPIKSGGMLEFTFEGDLVLKDADGTVAWSTNTSGKSVVRLKLTDLGNLVLSDEDNATVWQSFDEPTDSLVPGQKLRPGQRLIPSVSETNWTIDGIITLSFDGQNLSAQVETNPPQIYFFVGFYLDPDASIESPYVEFVNGSLVYVTNYSTWSRTFLSFPFASSAQYMKLGSDGHLRVDEFQWGSEAVKEVADLFTEQIGECGYPTVCGPYGICSAGQCSCPAWRGQTSYFQQVDDRHPNLGCSESVPLSCGASQYQSLLELENVTYSNISTPDLVHVDALRCKEACAKNCSCKAAIFRHQGDPTNGSCHLPSQVFSLANVDDKPGLQNSTAFLKVQNVANQAPNSSVDKRRRNRLPAVLGSSLGALFAMMIFIVVILVFVQKRDDDQAEEDYLDQLPDMPTRFTYDNLKIITDKFSKKLGQGGFGSVFEGSLSDGTKVAVKCLDGFGQVKKSFLAEVETIGHIHHVNLVRLVGFCAEKSHRLLIYEYMSNGSLDRWIFHKSNECVLDWQQRKKIILDIAKGLNYLHEDCRKKIVHLDIKPQNILLDGNFNAKVADFGLSKLIDRDQSQVVTTMRGTLGYLAPEWLSATITEKVDVYSFGVVILEIVCGRKIFDRFLDEEDMYLLSLFKRKAEEGRLLDIVDKYMDNAQVNGPHAVNMTKIAAWCLQRDYTKRPSMSTIIKVLEGVMEAQEDLDYNFYAQPSTVGAATFNQTDAELVATTTLLPSVLSGPR